MTQLGQNRRFVQECMDAINPYITGQADTCSYCERLDPLILAEGTHTVITLAIGQIIPGYLQIYPKEHRTSAASLSEDEATEFEKMKRVIRDTYEQVYGNRGIAFEHGKVGACMLKEPEKYVEQRNSLCHHMHTHFVPAVIDIREKIKKCVPEEITVSNVAELIELRKTWMQSDPYLYFEDVDSVGYVYPVDEVDNIPRQFLRTCVAEVLGVPERADWFKYPGKEFFSEGKRELQPVLKKILNR